VRMAIQTLGVVAALSLVSSVTLAATKAVDPDKLPKVECSALVYSKEFLDKYPRAPAACLDARVYRGETYLKVKGKVYILEKPMLAVAFMDPFGNTLGSVTVSDLKLRVIVNGKEVNVSDLRTGEELTFWVPESIFAGGLVTANR